MWGDWWKAHRLELTVQWGIIFCAFLLWSLGCGAQALIRWWRSRK